MLIKHIMRGNSLVKIMIVDDQALLRKSLAQLIDIDDEISVVAMAETGKEAVSTCQQFQPDIVMMDIEMPEMDGINALKKIKEQCPKTRVIILTTFDSKEHIIDAFLAHADGYITKEIAPQELIATIKCVSYGLTVIHENVKNIMIDKFEEVKPPLLAGTMQLSPEDIEIIKLIVDGKSNKYIGATLNYTEGTVKNKVSRIYEKLKLTDRLQLAVYAVENNIV